MPYFIYQVARNKTVPEENTFKQIHSSNVYQFVNNGKKIIFLYMAFYQLHKTKLISASIEEVWNFIASPKNLREITPAYMGFEITSKNLPEKMYPGMIISYTVKPLLGLKMVWVTEITHVVEMKYFIDFQKIGPYSFWHHQHFIEPAGKKVLMTDIVSYAPPLGFIGGFANNLFIRRQLDAIFNYRELKMEYYFSGHLQE